VHHRPARRGLALRPRRAVPLLALGVLLVVLGIAAPVVSEAVTGGTPVSLDSSSLGTATPLRDGGVRMGVDGAEEPGNTAPAGPSSSVAGSAGSSARSAAGGAGTTGAVPSEEPTTSRSAARSATSAAGSASADTTTGAPAAATRSGAPSSAGTSSPAAGSSVSGGTATATGTASSASPSPAAVTPAAALVAGAGDALLALVNGARADAGCAALTSDADLTDQAELRSTGMARDGSLSSGSTALVAKGADARSAVEGWLADASDRARLLDCDRSRFGAAEVTGPGGPWWTALVA
jgi:uncharacterized protein YkwD